MFIEFERTKGQPVLVNINFIQAITPASGGGTFVHLSAPDLVKVRVKGEYVEVLTKINLEAKISVVR